MGKLTSIEPIDGQLRIERRRHQLVRNRRYDGTAKEWVSEQEYEYRFAQRQKARAA